MASHGPTRQQAGRRAQGAVDDVAPGWPRAGGRLTTRQLRFEAASKTMPSRQPSSSTVSPRGPGTKMSSSQNARGPGCQVCTSPVCVSILAKACGHPAAWTRSGRAQAGSRVWGRQAVCCPRPPHPVRLTRSHQQRQADERAHAMPGRSMPSRVCTCVWVRTAAHRLPQAGAQSGDGEAELRRCELGAAHSRLTGTAGLQACSCGPAPEAAAHLGWHGSAPLGVAAGIHIAEARRPRVEVRVDLGVVRVLGIEEHLPPHLTRSRVDPARVHMALMQALPAGLSAAPPYTAPTEGWPAQPKAVASLRAARPLRMGQQSSWWSSCGAVHLLARHRGPCKPSRSQAARQSSRAGSTRWPRRHARQRTPLAPKARQDRVPAHLAPPSPRRGWQALVPLQARPAGWCAHRWRQMEVRGMPSKSPCSTGFQLPSMPAPAASAPSASGPHPLLHTTTSSPSSNAFAWWITKQRSVSRTCRQHAQGQRQPSSCCTAVQRQVASHRPQSGAVMKAPHCDSAGVNGDAHKRLDCTCTSRGGSPAALAAQAACMAALAAEDSSPQVPGDNACTCCCRWPAVRPVCAGASRQGPPGVPRPCEAPG